MKLGAQWITERNLQRPLASKFKIAIRIGRCLCWCVIAYTGDLYSCDGLVSACIDDTTIGG